MGSVRDGRTCHVSRGPVRVGGYDDLIVSVAVVSMRRDAEGLEENEPET